MTSSIALSLNSTVGHPGGEEPFPPPESALVMGSSAASSRSLPIFAPSRIAGSRPETAISPQVEAVKDAAMMLLRIDWTAYWGGERERDTESGKREEERAREKRGRERQREREREGELYFFFFSSSERKETKNRSYRLRRAVAWRCGDCVEPAGPRDSGRGGHAQGGFAEERREEEDEGVVGCCWGGEGGSGSGSGSGGRNTGQG